MPLTENGSEVFVATMTTFFSNSYDALEETLTPMKSTKLKSHPGENVTYLCTEILVDVECLGNSGSLKPEHLEYTNQIFEDNYDSRLRPWKIQKYKEDMEFIKKLLVCDMYIISPEYLKTYSTLLQEATREYCNIVD